MLNLAEQLMELLLKKRLVLAVAESCTGGLLAATITHTPGASRVFDRGFVTYSNEAKADSLSVPKEMIMEHGAVSAEVAEAMAKGTLAHSRADIAVSITGIAGPDGGSEQKPVGTVFMGYAMRGGSSGAVAHHFSGARADIRSQSVSAAVKHLIYILQSEGAGHE